MVYDLKENLSAKQKTIVDAVFNHATALLDHTPRFKYFTLHGTQHLTNLFGIADLFGQAGLRLNSDEAFLLSCAICTHDLGMVVPLREKTISELLWGKPQASDPAMIENEIRKTHHELVSSYVQQHFDFLSALGLNASEVAVIRDIGRGHRKTDLTAATGYARSLGALLRLIDELDIGPRRAPAAILLREYQQMDSTACWHWFKHNICEDWRARHNFEFWTNANSSTLIKLLVATHPPTASSVPYWLTQVRRPILKVMHDEGAARIIAETWNVQITLDAATDLSSPVDLGSPWSEIEEKALSAGRKVVMVIDDEARKMEDLMLPLMQTYHVVFASNAKDALDKMAAGRVDLAIVDLQVGSGLIWSASETMDFKLTGQKLVGEIVRMFPQTKVGILTGSRHDLTEVAAIPELKFLLRKPIDPDTLEQEVTRVLA